MNYVSVSERGNCQVDPQKCQALYPAAGLLTEPPPTVPSQHLPPKLMGTKKPKVSSSKNRGGAIKNKDQGFGFSMTLVPRRRHHAYLAQFPPPMPSGKQEAAIGAGGSASLTISTAPSPARPLPMQAACSEPPELCSREPSSPQLSEIRWAQRPGTHSAAPKPAALHRGSGSGGRGERDWRRKGGLWVGGAVGESICRSKGSWDWAASRGGVNF